MFKKLAKRNWKTTAAGLGTLALAAWQIYHAPATAADPQTVATVTAGIGLILASDAKPAAAETAGAPKEPRR